MRVVLQRVKRASVTVDARVTGAIDVGLLVLVGFTDSDGAAEVDWMMEKIVGLRLFPDDDDKMNRSLLDVGGSILVVSQFTLYGDVRKGRRPSFVGAASPDHAVPLYQRFIEAFRQKGVHTEEGEFGAMMDVELVNWGPVTISIER